MRKKRFQKRYNYKKYDYRKEFKRELRKNRFKRKLQMKGIKRAINTARMNLYVNSLISPEDKPFEDKTLSEKYSFLEYNNKRFILLISIPSITVDIIVSIRNIIRYMNGEDFNYGLITSGNQWYNIVEAFFSAFGILSVAFFIFWISIDAIQMHIRFVFNKKEDRKKRIHFIKEFLWFILMCIIFFIYGIFKILRSI